MCHHVHVRLSEDEAKDVRKLSGLMIPVYASVAVAVIALVAVTGAAPQTAMIASVSSVSR